MTDTGSPLTSSTPYWRNILFSNITATAATSFAVGSVWGLPEAPVTNLVMKNVSLTGASGLQIRNWACPRGEFCERLQHQCATRRATVYL